MDWISKYRLNPGWFFESNSPELEEIYEIIKNHDFSDRSDIRDDKISHILDDNFVDPLSYLNKYINLLSNRFGVNRVSSMGGPVIQIYYIEKNLDEGIHTHGLVKSESRATITEVFNNIEDFESWITIKLLDNEILIYQINEVESKILLRCSLIDRKINRIRIN